MYSSIEPHQIASLSLLFSFGTYTMNETKSKQDKFPVPTDKFQKGASL